MNKDTKEAIISFLINAIQVCMVIFIIESIYRGSISATQEWIKEYFTQFLYNFLLLFLIYGSFLIFKRKLYIFFSFIVSIGLITLAIACNVKQAIRGEPVLPSDLLLGAEATNMAGIFSRSTLTGLIVGFASVIILVAFVIYKTPNQVNRNRKKIISAFIVFFSCLLIFNIEKNDEKTILKSIFQIKNNVWIQSETYQKNGVVASFVMNLQWLKLEMPEGYSKKSVDQIVNDLEITESGDSEKPNIIVIMSEAFWDPTIMENIEFNKDPLPFFHKLEGEHTSGQLTVPVFGGSTANTEFEVLTGISSQLLPVSSIPYLHYINKPIPALPYLLKEQGYDTTAIHTFHHWFYNRSSVYKYLGFNRFISMEYLENPVPVGPYFHDSNITDEILKKLDLTPDQPNFIFAVTTQNHGPYSETEKMPFANIEVENNKDKNGLSKSSINMLEVYSDNLSESDRELERLITELEKKDKKTIVIFFGDHLPLLGENYKVYKQTGFYKKNKSYEQYLKMYSTPIVIWDNFSSENEDLSIGSTMLSPIILEKAGLHGNYLTDYLHTKYKNGELKKIVRSDFLKKEKIRAKTIKEINLLQYDMLFGEMYGIGKVKPNKQYHFGYGSPQIESVSVQEEPNEILVHLKGQYFTSHSSVYINGDKVDIRSVDSTNILVPYAGSLEEIEIVVKITDSYEKVLSESKPYLFHYK